MDKILTLRLTVEGWLETQLISTASMSHCLLIPPSAWCKAATISINTSQISNKDENFNCIMIFDCTSLIKTEDSNWPDCSQFNIIAFNFPNSENGIEPSLASLAFAWIFFRSPLKSVSLFRGSRFETCIWEKSQLNGEISTKMIHTLQTGKQEMQEVDATYLKKFV